MLPTFLTHQVDSTRGRGRRQARLCFWSESYSIGCLYTHGETDGRPAENTREVSLLVNKGFTFRAGLL